MTKLYIVADSEGPHPEMWTEEHAEAFQKAYRRYRLRRPFRVISVLLILAYFFLYDSSFWEVLVIVALLGGVMQIFSVYDDGYSDKGSDVVFKFRKKWSLNAGYKNIAAYFRDLYVLLFENTWKFIIELIILPLKLLLNYLLQVLEFVYEYVNLSAFEGYYDSRMNQNMERHIRGARATNHYGASGSSSE